MTQLFAEPVETATGRYAQVALEQGIDASADGLTYGVPKQLADLRVGERVMVPLGRKDKPSPGYVIQLSDHTELDVRKVKSILARDKQGISLTSDLIELAGWIAGYYCCPIGMVFATMLPAAVKKGTGRVSQIMVGLAAAETPAVETTVEVEGSVDLPSPSGRGWPVPRPGEGVSAEGSPEAGSSSDVNMTSTPSPGVDTRHPLPEGEGKAPESPDPPKHRARRLSKMQEAVLATVSELAAANIHWTEIKELADRAGARSIAPVRQLVEKGLLVARHQEVVQALRGGPMGDVAAPVKAPLLNKSQKLAVERVVQSIHSGFSVHVLHGVTGSGKTEVYLRVLEEVMRGGEDEARRHPGAPGPKAQKEEGNAPSEVELSSPNQKSEIKNQKSPPGAIILVPEIALTPQTVGRFVARFDSVAVMHSGLTAAQRHEQWRRIRSGEARVVVGARSAIFAPLENLKVIIVDEEHEYSYKQDQLPRYQARDVAIKRAQLLGIPVVLGSATPSLESYFNATHPGAKKSYQLHNLPERVAGLTLPKVEIVDMSDERRKRYEYSGPGGVHLLSIRLEKALQRVIEAKGQAILLLNRRGYANYIACPDHRCGWMMNCELCDATMVYHKDAALPLGGLVRCHHCTAEQLLPPYCPTCGKKVSVFGLGTQRVEEEIARKFLAARVLRMDSDAMRTSKDYARSLDSFRNGEVDILVGTQMIAKGLDFPNVHVVGVISADTALNMPDFRAGERTFQLISQVAGRAGRGGKDNPGTVIVQTFSPNDPAIVLAAAHDYEAFATREIELRRQVGLPPVTRMARIVIRDLDHMACLEQANKVSDALSGANKTLGGLVRLRGPAPCPIGRIAGYFRQQIELIGPDAASIQRLLTAVRNARLLHADATTAVDVDPVALM